MSQPTESGDQGPRPVSRRRLLRAAGVGGVSLVAGCGFLGGDSDGVRADQSEPPDADFEWDQSTGYASTNELTVEIHHEGGDPIDVETLSITIDDGEEYDGVPHTETDLWRWDDILDSERDFDALGDTMAEGDVVAIRSNPSSAELATTEDVTATVRLVWASPETGETHVLTTYELRECVGNEDENVQRCS